MGFVKETVDIINSLIGLILCLILLTLPFWVSYGIYKHECDLINDYNEKIDNIIIYKTNINVIGKRIMDENKYIVVTDKGDFIVNSKDYFTLEEKKNYIFYTYAVREDNDISPCMIYESYSNICLKGSSYFYLNGYENI